MSVNFKHFQSAHCENGVTCNLLKHEGLDRITEPLAFGMGSGLFYIHIPFLQVNNGPAISFRTMPGMIFKRTCHALGIEVIRKKFSSPLRARTFLDESLASGKPVGCQVGVFYLTYFPKEYRFHFNAHNLVVYAKEGDEYLISDPVMEHPTRLSDFELQRVRFAKGAFAPRGQVYYPVIKGAITEQQIRFGIRKGIKRNVHHMLHVPAPFAGIKGIRYTAGKILHWRDKLGEVKAGLHLAQLVRMQEEIGTGGGGFRFIFAAFLQEAHHYYPIDELLRISEQFTRAGDTWRSSAVQAAGIFKGRLNSQNDFKDMADFLLEVAEIEKSAFMDLSKIKW